MTRTVPILVAGALVLLAALPTHGEPEITFTDVTESSEIRYVNLCGAEPESKGWITETMGAGAAWLDYDGDGNLDLFLVNGSTHEREADAGEPSQLYRGDGKGKFENVTRKAGVGHRGWGLGVAVGDIDNDGDPDLFVTNLGPNALLRNAGDGTFEEITAKAGVAGGALWSSSAAFFDMDSDGDLDLYVGNYMESDLERIPRRGTPDCVFQGLRVACGPRGFVPIQDQLYRNEGDGTFTDVTTSSGVHLKLPRYALGVVTADYDNDGDTDVYVANDSVANSLWKNRGDGTFEDVALTTMCSLSGDGKVQAGMGTDFGDYDGDGWLDIVVTNFSHDIDTLYRNRRGKFFVDDSLAVGLGTTRWTLGWGVKLVDLDHDTDLDLFVANGHAYPEVDGGDVGTSFRQHNQIFVNENGALRELPAAAGLKVKRSFRGAAFGDYDNDGDVDVALTALGEPLLLLRNDTPRKGHFLTLHLEGTRSNRDAIGARVTVTLGERRLIRDRKSGGSFLSGHDPRMNIGIGAATRADRVEVRWPSGAMQRLDDVAADRMLAIREPADDESR